MELGNRIKQIIDYSGLSRSDFAQLIGKGETSIYNYINETTHLNTEQLKLIKEKIKELDLNWFITGDGQMVIYDKENIITDSCQERIKELLKYINTQSDLIELLKKNQAIQMLFIDLCRLKNGTKKTFFTLFKMCI